MIAFVGSVFSPYYAWSKWRDPENHCAVNIALYGPRKKRWAMTERGRSALTRTADQLSIGDSRLSFDGTQFTVEISERAVPHLTPIRGRLRITPNVTTARPWQLDAQGRHWWWPFAPLSRIEVTMDRPRFSWSGSAYLDMNAGSEPLDQGFVRWDWSRADTGPGATILYDMTRRDGSEACLALRVDESGEVSEFDPPSRTRLASTVWRVPRFSRTGPGDTQVIKTLEDTPFYARSLISSAESGELALAVHESLSLDRIRSPIVRLMLPFRMPRRGR